MIHQFLFFPLKYQGQNSALYFAVSVDLRVFRIITIQRAASRRHLSALKRWRCRQMAINTTDSLIQTLVFCKLLIVSFMFTKQYLKLLTVIITSFLSTPFSPCFQLLRKSKAGLLQQLDQDMFASIFGLRFFVLIVGSSMSWYGPHCTLLLLIDFCPVQSEFLTWSFVY